MEAEIRNCRLCFSEEVNEHSLFQMVDDNGISLSTKIVLCTSLMMTQEDLYSEYICHNCVQMIELFYEFRNTCLKTHISMYNVIHGISPSKYNLTDQENMEKESGADITANPEVEIFSENNDTEHSIEIESVDVDKRENKLLSITPSKGELNEHIDINEDSSRQFQLSIGNECYSITAENSSINIKQT